MLKNEFGVEAIGTAIPSLAMPLTELNPNNQAHSYMSLCSTAENVITLATKAAKRALDNWNNEHNLTGARSIGLIVVATETAVDMSRPLSAWVMQNLGLSGNIRSYEVKHACLGGTIALRQAYEWLSTNYRFDKSKVALVICADVALYAKDHSGEPTQGAGSMAFIVGDSPSIFSIDPKSFYWSMPQFDFWRPVGEDYPSVNGRLTLSCYNNAVLNCFTQLANLEDLQTTLDNYQYLNFHVPFPKMVETSFNNLARKANWDLVTTEKIFKQKILPTMQFNLQLGNSYTGSLWFSVACSLTLMQAKEQMLAFSFGSGCGAELLTLKCIANQKDSIWLQELKQDLAQRTIISYQHYCELRNSYVKQVTNN